MKPDPAENRLWDAIGTHSGVFPKNPARDFSSGAIYFPVQCVPLRPEPTPGRGRIPKRWAMARPRIVGYRGSAHPPAEPPARKDPERGCAGGCRADGQPAAHSPGRPCRGGASVARWRPCPFIRHPHRPGIASRDSGPCRLSDRPRLLFPGTGLAVFRSGAGQPGPADPRQWIPAHAGRPCRPPDSRPHAGNRR